MSNSTFRSYLGLATVAAILSSSLVVSPSVSAFTISGNTIQDITNKDIGQSFTISFNGKVSSTDTAGLSSEATLTIAGFETVTKLINGITKQFTEVKFDISLVNTSTGNVATSRTSSIGFDVSSPLVAATVAGIDANTPPLFTKANLNTKIFEGKPTEGIVDVCFSNNTNNCRGGQNGGVKTGEAKGSFSSSLYFDSSVKKIALDNFGVRYQSIDFANSKKFDDQSGSGYAVTVVPNGSKNWKDSKGSQYW